MMRQSFSCLRLVVVVQMLLVLVLAVVLSLGCGVGASATAPSETTRTGPILADQQQAENSNKKKKRTLRFGMASGGSSFFDPVKEGWFETCSRMMDVECTYFTDDMSSCFSDGTATTTTTATASTPTSDTNNTTNSGCVMISFKETTDIHPCVAQMRYFVDNGYDGIAIQCGVDHPTIYHEVAAANIPIVSFDIPPPRSQPISTYVGTDNHYLGRTMARLLRLLRPEGGTYHVVSFVRIPERYQGFVQEIEKYNHRDDRAHWIKATTNFSGQLEGDNVTTGESLGDAHLRYSNLQRIANYNPDAIIFMYQTPMRVTNYSTFVEQNRFRNITIIGTQGSNDELELMARRQVDGLVGQVTYDMGRLSIETLYQLSTTTRSETTATTKTFEDADDTATIQPSSTSSSSLLASSSSSSRQFKFTKLINYNLVLEELPATEIDESLLGNLRIAGLLCFGIVAVCAILCLSWSIYYRQDNIVKASQPFFLIMTATGVLLLSSSLVPLSFDDNGTSDDDDGLVPDQPHFRSRLICMSVPWLAFVGFTVTFSALFAKTWRVNQFFHSTNRFERIQVSHQEVMKPFAILLCLNIIVLSCWTILDPLTYIREYDAGTDLYNREIASNGYCRSKYSIAFLAPLALINFSLLVTACMQAFEARDIKSEFAEAKYIGITVFLLAQAFVTGIPIVVIVKDIPEAYYLVLTFIIFVLSMVVLSLIFLPKMHMQRRYSQMAPAEQRRAMEVSVRLSAGQSLSAISGLNAGNSPSRLDRRNHQDNKNVDNDPDNNNSKPSPVSPPQHGTKKEDGATTGPKHDSSIEPSDSADLGSMVERMEDIAEHAARVIRHSSYVSGEAVDA